jgi:hypothetical protein
MHPAAHMGATQMLFAFLLLMQVAVVAACAGGVRRTLTGHVMVFITADTARLEVPLRSFYQLAGCDFGGWRWRREEGLYWPCDGLSNCSSSSSCNLVTVKCNVCYVRRWQWWRLALVA